MEIDFSSAGEETLEEALSNNSDPSVHVSSDRPLEDLYNATLLLKDKVSVVKNAGISNRVEERERFMDAWDNGKGFEPDFEFQNFPYNAETTLMVLEKLKQELEKIDQETMKKYGARELGAQDVRDLFKGLFQEYRLYVQLVDSIDDRERWKKNSLEIWPMIDQGHVDKCRKKLEKGFKVEEKDKDLDSHDLKSMWKEELECLGVEWNIEVREVGGCFNIPEERTVVVADGSNEKRYYSREEARMLTMHELFHVTRAYNGIKAGESAGLPPILGLHTPFYDMTEEGGAIYREKQTNVDYPEKGKDYYLRALAAYYQHQDIEFQEIVEKLVDLGGSVERSFYLAARNREMLRHHIYLGGYWKQWKQRENVEPLLLGKVNPEWAERLWSEVEAEGMLEKPPVTSNDLFD